MSLKICEFDPSKKYYIRLNNEENLKPDQLHEKARYFVEAFTKIGIEVVVGFDDIEITEIKEVEEYDTGII